MSICYVLPYEIADGPANMALDEALLDEVAGGAEAMYLRTYGWTVPTLSLGYFQRIEEARADPRWQSVPWVRRPTGGGAILHHHEVTYALVVPPGHLLARPRTGLYRAVHGAIAEILVGLGVAARRWGNGAPVALGERKRALLCFTDRSPEDIVSNEHKLVGSAQRRRAGAILQHGTVLLARSWHTQEFVGVCDVADVPSRAEAWAQWLLARIPTALGQRALAAPIPERVRERAGNLERSVYRNPKWTGRR
jgi:lipoyl(octanoyl) transferase